MKTKSMFGRFLSVAVVVGMVAITQAGAASITCVGIDTTTQAGWRTTSVTKTNDIDGDNAYGSDGWMTANAVSNPPYATLALINGEPDAPFPNYMWVDQALTPASSVADERANPSTTS